MGPLGVLAKASGFSKGMPTQPAGYGKPVQTHGPQEFHESFNYLYDEAMAIANDPNTPSAEKQKAVGMASRFDEAHNLVADKERIAKLKNDVSISAEKRAQLRIAEETVNKRLRSYFDALKSGVEEDTYGAPTPEEP